MKKLLMICGLAALMVGCAASPINGAITMAKWDGGVANPDVSTMKTGKACAQSYIGIVALGDASIEAAKKDGGITKVSLVDHETTNYAYFYGEYCTIVMGE